LYEVRERRNDVENCWGFVERAFVDPAPFQRGLPSHITRGARVVWPSKRCANIILSVPTWQDAIGYALLYEKVAAQMSKVTCNTCSFLPATILDYGYEAEVQPINRVVGGIAVADISGGVGHHREELRLCLVENDTATSLYCWIIVAIEKPIYHQRCRVGDDRFTGPLPPSRVVVSYNSGTPIRHTSHGELVSGNYNKVCMLDSGASLNAWLPKKG
jgi:hypothetical protein